MDDWGAWQGAERATGNLLNVGMQLQNNQANQQIRQDEMDIQRQGMQNTVAYQNRTLANDEKRIAIDQAKLPAPDQPYDKSSVSSMRSKWLMLGFDKSTVDKLTSIAEPLAENGSVRRGDAGGWMRDNFTATVQPHITGTLGEVSDKLSEKLANPNILPADRKSLSSQLAKTLEIQREFAGMTPDKFYQTQFSDLAQHDANTKAALEAAKGYTLAEGAMRVNPDKSVVTNPKTFDPAARADKNEQRVQRQIDTDIRQGTTWIRRTFDDPIHEMEMKLTKELSYKDTPQETVKAWEDKINLYKERKTQAENTLAGVAGGQYTWKQVMDGYKGGQTAQSPVLKPMTTDVENQIRAKAKTRVEAESMAISMGYDPNVRAR